MGFVVDQNLELQRDDDLGTYETFEMMSVNLATKKPINFTLIYRPPPSPKNGFTTAKFLEELEELLSKLVTRIPHDLCLLGDFNLHVECRRDPNVMKLFSITESMGLMQHVCEPTHTSGHMLDLIFTRTDASRCNLTVMETKDTGLSDHFAILCKVDQQLIDLCKQTKLSRSIRRVNHEMYANDLRHELNHLEDGDGVGLETLTNAFTTSCQSVTDAHAPIRTITMKGDALKPWYNDAIHDARKERRKLERKFNKTRLEVHREALREQERRVVRMIKQNKIAYYCDRFTQASQKESWELINSLLNNENAIPMPKGYSKEELPQTFCDFFTDKVQKIREELDSQQPEDNLSEDIPQVSTNISAFEPVDAEEVKAVIMRCSTKTCSLDVIPTALLKIPAILQSCVHIITRIFNESLSSGNVPNYMKRAVIRPSLKKSNLDVNCLSNYRPVSNIPFLGKVLEKIVSKQLVAHLQRHGIGDPLQSAYKQGASTETAMMHIKEEIDRILDNGDAVLMVLLDLSAAFDTIDHDMLLDRLRRHVGLDGAALRWVASYMSGRTQCVSIDGSFSQAADLTIGVPQGSVLGPLLFLVYILPLRHVIEGHGIKRHGYADDTQLFSKMTWRNPVACDEEILRMEKCLSDVRKWMIGNKLKMNASKTEVIIFHNGRFERDIRIRIGEELIEPKAKVRNLGCHLDTQFKMDAHINNATSVGYYQLRRIAKVRPHLSDRACANVIQSQIVSRLDYHNGMLLGLPASHTRKLQLLQNNAARLLTRTKMREHITPVLARLHWLPVEARVQFKTLCHIHRAIHSPHAPPYMQNMISLYHPRRDLRSNDSNFVLDIPRVNNAYGRRSLTHTGATLWNGLPDELRCTVSFMTFKKNLKTVLFRKFYPL